MFARFIRAHIYLIISGILGAIAFLVLYSRLLDPSYIDWTVMIGGDPFQHYIGWELFRASPWSFPLGHISQLVYPAGISLTFTDSIPLFSIFFKLFSSWLPFPFQFEGIWFLCCFVLQGMFGYSLIRRYVEREVYAVVGSVFFTLSPIMLFRLGGHSALGAHWLILWSLLLSLLPEGVIRIIQWTVLLSLAILIHPYFLFMCGVIFAADMTRRIWVTRAVTGKKGVLFFCGATTWTLFLAWAIGVFSAGGGSAPGYGVFSLDLNGLINPYGYSTILKNMNVREPNEGFAYLGFGVLMMGLLSLFEIMKEIRKETVRKWLLRWWPLIGAGVVLTLVAVTNVVSVWGRELVTIPLPRVLREDVLGVVRSSGRLFWPVYYVIMLGSLFVLKKTRLWLGVMLIGITVVLQVYDMKDKLQENQMYFTRQEWQTPLNDPFWEYASKAFDHISFVPTFAHGSYEAIALFAAEHGLTLNTGYVVRAAGLLNEEFMKTEQENIKKGIIADRTLYIFRFEEEAREFTKNVDPLKFQLKTIDGYTLLAPSDMKGKN